MADSATIPPLDRRDVAVPGYIRLSRKVLTSDWWNEDRPRTRFEAWIDLLMWARFSDGPCNYCGDVIALKRGEFVASLRFLADRWRWTVRAVRDFLAICVRNGRLLLQTKAKQRSQARAQLRAQLRAQHRAQLASVYLIVNYDKYNPVTLFPGTVAGTVAGTPKGTKKKKDIQEGIQETLVGGPPTNWVDRAVEIYAEHIGLIGHGRMGKALKPAVARFGWDDVQTWLAAYGRWRPIQRRDGSYPESFLEAEKNVRYCSPEDFVHTITVWREMCQPAELARHA